MRQRENRLDQSFVYKKLKRELVHRYGKEKACAIWEEAGGKLRTFETAEPEAENPRSLRCRPRNLPKRKKQKE